MLHALLLSFDNETNLGRIDRSSLSQQSCMELLIGSLPDDTKEVHFQDDEGEFLECCSWNRITCDADGNVIKVDLRFRYAGTMSFDFIPESVIEAEFGSCAMSGTLDTLKLPRSMQNFDISDTLCNGTVDLPGLPETLHTLQLRGSRFSGSLDLTSLPLSLEILKLDRNMFMGTISLEKLPPSLQVLFLDCNDLSGRLDLGSLPARIRLLDLSNNAFTGEFCLVQPIESLHILRAADCKLSGTAVVHSSVNKGKVNLKGNAMEAVVDERGNVYPGWY